MELMVAMDDTDVDEKAREYQQGQQPEEGKTAALVCCNG
jgi:hypothetical protein